MAAGFATVYVPAASGQPLADNAPRVYSTPDSAVVVLDSRVAMMDLSVLAVPAEVHQPGKQPGGVIQVLACELNEPAGAATHTEYQASLTESVTLFQGC